MNKQHSVQKTVEPVLVDYKNNNQLRKYGVAFHWWDSSTTSLHHHNHYEFFIVTNGKALHRLNGVSTEVTANTLHMIRPDDNHQFAPSNNSRCIHINISLTTEKLESICHSMNIDLQALLNNTQLSTRLSQKQSEFFIERAEQVNFMWHGNFNKDDVISIVCQTIVEAMLLLINGRTHGYKTYPEWFNKILSQMHSPEFLEKSVSDIYSLSNYSSTALISYFKKYTGDTVVVYFTRVKMARACSLLRNSSMTTLEISSRLGFDSLSHFNKMFKKYIDMTPTQYKKQFLQPTS